MKSLRQVWAAAQRNPCAKRTLSGIGAEPKATIAIPIRFNTLIEGIEYAPKYFFANRCNKAPGPGP